MLRGALQATKANGQPDWQIRVSAARTLAALPPEEPEPEPEPDSATLVYDLPPGSSPILHCALPPIFAPATTTEPPVEPLPEPGLYLFKGEKGPMIPLVKHAADDGAQAHVLTSYAAAADLLRAFGGDPRILDTPDADPQPNTPNQTPAHTHPNERRVAVPAERDALDMPQSSSTGTQGTAAIPISTWVCGGDWHEGRNGQVCPDVLPAGVDRLGRVFL